MSNETESEHRDRSSEFDPENGFANVSVNCEKLHT